METIAPSDVQPGGPQFWGPPNQVVRARAATAHPKCSPKSQTRQPPIPTQGHVQPTARWTTPFLAGLCCTKYGTLAHPLRDTAQPSTSLHTVQGKAPSIVRQCPPHSQDSCTHIARQCIPQPLQVTVRVITKTLPPPIYKKSSHPLQDNVPTPITRRVVHPLQDNASLIGDNSS